MIIKIVVLFFFSHLICANELSFLIKQAIEKNPEILSAKKSVQSKKQKMKSMGWAFFPQPSIQLQNAFASKNNPNFTGDDLVFSVSLEQPIWDGGRRLADLNEAKVESEIAHIGLIKTQYEVSFNLLKQFKSWLSANLKMKAISKSLEAHDKLQERVKNRVKMGVSNQGDIALVKGRIEALKADLYHQQFLREAALAALVETVQNPLSHTVLNLHNYEYLPEYNVIFEVDFNQVFAIHPNVTRTQLKTQLQQQLVKKQKSRLWPEIYLKAERQFGHFALEDSAPMNSMIVGFKSHFGSGLSVVSDTRSEIAALKSLQFHTDNEKNKLRQTLLSDHHHLIALQARIKSTNESIALSNQVFESYTRQFLSGKKSWLDVMNSLREQTSNYIKKADLIAQYQTLFKKNHINIYGFTQL